MDKGLEIKTKKETICPCIGPRQTNENVLKNKDEDIVHKSL